MSSAMLPVVSMTKHTTDERAIPIILWKHREFHYSSPKREQRSWFSFLSFSLFYRRTSGSRRPLQLSGCPPAAGGWRLWLRSQQRCGRPRCPSAARLCWCLLVELLCSWGRLDLRGCTYLARHTRGDTKWVSGYLYYLLNMHFYGQHSFMEQLNYVWLGRKPWSYCCCMDFFNSNEGNC